MGYETAPSRAAAILPHPLPVGGTPWGGADYGSADEMIPFRNAVCDPPANVRVSPTAPFVLFAMAQIAIFIRLGDMIPEMTGVPIFRGCLFLAGMAGLPQIIKRFRPSRLKGDPVSACVVGLMFSIVLSHASHMALSESLRAGGMAFELFLYYALLVTTVDSTARMKKYLCVVACAATTMAAMCVFDYVGWYELPAIEHLNALEGVDDANVDQLVPRMRGVGIFSDPNDIAISIVHTAVIASYLLVSGRRSTRYGWLIPLALLAAGLVFTRSRGGLLSGGAAFLLLAYTRWGKSAAIAGGLAGLLLVPLVISGRQAEIDLESDTGQDRVLLWREGLEAMKSPELLFGTGERSYPDLTGGLVAHNSFLHAFTELGLFGGAWFLGAFLSGGMLLQRLIRNRSRIDDPELQSLGPFIAALFAGWVVGMMSLSRCYVMPTYFVLGTASAYAQLAERSALPWRPGVLFDQKQLVRIACGSVLFLAAMVMAVKILAR